MHIVVSGHLLQHLTLPRATNFVSDHEGAGVVAEVGTARTLAVDPISQITLWLASSAK